MKKKNTRSTQTEKTFVGQYNGEPIYKVGSMKIKIRTRVFNLDKVREYRDPQTDILLFDKPIDFIAWAINSMDEIDALFDRGFVYDALNLDNELSKLTA